MRALAGVAVLGVVALSGCSDSSAEPRVLPSLTAAPSPSPVATPTGKDAPTPEGAAEFAKFVYAQIEQAFATRNPDLVRQLSEPRCESCQQYLASLDKLRANNERVEGFHIEIQDAIAPALANPTAARVDVIWSHNGSRRLDSTGHLIREEPPASGIEEQVDLVRRGATWRIAEILRIRVRG